ncbi:MAG: GNAT family N-acetyltransferase [Candidatus Thermoplasmatota archaeon]|nr:GNAT family N-acetyltransferase [Candidatus Thermoplasmatota archaeon]
MEIRKFLPGDVDQICDLEKRAFGIGAYSRSMIKRMFAAPDVIDFLAVDGKRILGYVCALPIDESSADIESIAIDPSMHRSGLGTLLYNRVESELLRKGYRVVILEVRENNMQAINFYKKHGFKATEFLQNYYKVAVDGTRNAYRMKKFLDL